MSYLFPTPGKSPSASYWFSSDKRFNQLYPQDAQVHARRHWTPLQVARLASRFLGAEPGARVLDIGSGVGKFCLASAWYTPGAFYFGVEQRRTLVLQARAAQMQLGLSNAAFLHGNFSAIDFNQYQHFYFYNAFYENLVDMDRIDESITFSAELYNYYTRLLHAQLKLRPVGTRLVTFHCLDDVVPRGYRLVRAEMDQLLKFWIKH